MSVGLFGTDCVSSNYAWLDPGCAIESAGSDIGTAVTSALLPVWIVLAVVFAIILVIAFAPNIKHIVPHLSFL